MSAAALTELSTGQLLYKNRSFSRLPIASTTKLMTALITLEHVKHLGRIFTQNNFYASAVDSQIGLVPGERMSVHDLLLALLLPSADDAAEDLAYNVGHRSVARFVGMMNARARQLGLTRTHYSTPSGLDTPGNYSTATDLLTLARYLLLHQPWFARAVALPHALLKTGSHPRYVANRNDLVGRYSWVRGVKTGHTSGAGYVLVGAGASRGMEAPQRRHGHLERVRARRQHAAPARLGASDLPDRHARDRRTGDRPADREGSLRAYTPR